MAAGRRRRARAAAAALALALAVAVPAALLGPATAAPANPELDALNGALDGVKFGPDPGPCPASDHCVSLVEDMPEYVKEIEVELLPGIGFKIGDVLKSGTVEAWDTEAESLSFDDIIIGHDGVQATRLPVTATVDDLRMGAFSRAKFTDLQLQFAGFDFKISGTADLRITLADMLSDGDGISVNLAGFFDAPRGFEKYPPQFFNFLDREEGCDVRLGNGFSLEDLDIEGLDGLLGFILESGIRLLIFSLFKGLIEGIICQVIVQFAVLNSGEPGILNQLLDEATVAIDSYEALGTRVRSHFEADEQQFATPDLTQNAVDFATDDQFEMLSALVNELLGSPATRAPHIGTPAINEVIDAIVGSSSGVLSIPNVQEAFNLDTPPSTTVPASLTDVTLTLVALELAGANTFTDFNILDNGFADRASFGEPYHYTLLHALDLQFSQPKAVFDLTLSPGEWVNPSGEQKTISFRFSIAARVETVSLALASLSLVETEPILALQVGQLFSGACLLQGLARARLSGLSAAIGSIADFALIDFFDLETLARSVVDLTNTILRGTLEAQLPYILDNFARIELNHFLTALVEGDDETADTCDAFDPAAFDYELLDSLINVGTAGIEFALNSVVGGAPVTVNPLDINNLADSVLRYILLTTDPDSGVEDPIFQSPATGSWILNRGLSFVSETQGVSADISIANPRLENLHSIWELATEVSEGNVIDFGAAIGNGTLAIIDEDGQPSTLFRGPLAVELPARLNALVDGIQYANDDATFFVRLAITVNGSAAISVDTDLTLKSQMATLLDYPGCLFALVQDQSLDIRSLRLDSFRVGAEPSNSNDDGFDLSTSVGAALGNWTAAMDTPQVQVSTESFLNAVLSGGARLAMDAVAKGFDPPYDTATCKDAQDPLDLPALDFSILQTVETILNEGTKHQPSPRGDDPADWEDQLAGSEPDKVWRLTDDSNGYVAAISAILTPNVVRNALVGLANTTELPSSNTSVLATLYEVLTLEPDETVAIRANPNLFAKLDYSTPAGEVELLPDLAIEWGDVVLLNIDQLSVLDILKPYTSDRAERARFTTAHTIKFSRPLQFSASVAVQMSSQVFGDAPEDAVLLRENVTIGFSLHQLSLELLFALVVDEPIMSKTQLGQLIYFDAETQMFDLRDNAVDCGIRPFIMEQGLNFPQFQANIAKLSGLSISSTGTLFSEETRDLIVAIIEMFVQVLRPNLPNLSQGPLREWLNSVMNEYFSIEKRDEMALTCVAWEDDPDFNKPQNLDLRPYSGLVADFIESDLMNPGSAFFAEDVLNAFLEEGMGSYALEGATLLYNGANLGTADLALGPFRIEGFGTSARIATLQFADTEPFPGSQYQARTAIKTEGDLFFAGQFSYTFDGLFTGPVDAAEAQVGSYVVHNDLQIGVHFTDLELLIDLETHVDVNGILNMYAGNVLDLYYRPSTVNCLLAVFQPQGLKPLNFSLVVDEVVLSVKCVGECSSPMLESLVVGEEFLTDATLSDQIVGLIDTAFALAPSLLAGQDLQGYIDTAVETARTECRGIDFSFELPGEDTYSYSVAGVMAFSFGGVLVLALVGALFVARVAARRRLAIQRLALGANKGDPKMDLILRKTIPLASHPVVKRRNRIAVPLVVLICTGLFLAANLFTIGVSVQIQFDVLGDETQHISLLDFTLGSSIDDMWHAKTYWLALIIFFASGAWPHTKSALMLVCWFAPPTILSVERRGRILGWLDALGKWSLIDAYVMFMLQVAFRFAISTSLMEQLSFLPQDLFVVQVVVIPGLSIYSFVVATCVSLAMSHVILVEHRHAVDSDLTLDDKIESSTPNPGFATIKTAAHKHVFATPDHDGRRYRLSPSGKLTLLALNMISVVIIGIGLFVPLMRFEFRGLAGFAITIIEPELGQNVQSAASIALALTDGIEGTLDQIGVRFLQLMFVLFTFVNPILLCGMLIMLLFKRFSLQDQRRLLFVAEILLAWDALVVFVVSVISAILQISDLAQWIVRSATGSYCAAVVEPLLFLGVPEGDALCFDVIASIEPTGYILFGAVVIALFNSAISLRFLRAVEHDRDLYSKGRADRLGVCPKSKKASVLVRWLVHPVTGNRAVDLSSALSTLSADSDLESRRSVRGRREPGSADSLGRNGETMSRMLAAHNPRFAKEAASRSRASSVESNPQRPANTRMELPRPTGPPKSARPFPYRAPPNPEDPGLDFF